MNLNQLLLLSGNDIPFREAQAVIHQPSIKEIGMIGQDSFFNGCEYLNFSKNKLSEQDKIRLKDLDDFEILMTIIKDNNLAMQQNRICIQLVLFLLFPDYACSFLPMSIMLSKKDQDGVLHKILIDKNNFVIFKQIITQMFCLNDIFENRTSKYNPGGPQANALVQKFKKRQQKLSKLKGQGQKKAITILSTYISILAVGQKKDINTLLQYTVYQLLDEFRRFMLKEDFDLYVKASLAGAQDLKEVENWMGDIHSDNL